MEFAIIAYLLAASTFYIKLCTMTDARGFSLVVYCIISAVASILWPLSFLYGLWLARQHNLR